MGDPKSHDTGRDAPRLEAILFGLVPTGDPRTAAEAAGSSRTTFRTKRSTSARFRSEKGSPRARPRQ